MTTVSLSVTPHTLGVGLRSELMQRGFRVVDDPAASDVLVADDPWAATDGALLWAAPHPPSRRELKDAFLGARVSGIILLERELESWAVAIRAVASGGTWIDPSTEIAGEIVLAAFRGMRWRGPLGLTHQQLQVLRLLPSRRTNAEIATALGVSPDTVKSHLTNAYRKLQAVDRAEAIERAKELGLVEP